MNVYQFLLIPLKFISRKAHLKLNSLAMGSVMKLMNYEFSYMNNCEIEISGDKMELNQSAVVISNHCGAADVYMMHRLASSAGMISYCKYFAKVSIN